MLKILTALFRYKTQSATGHTNAKLEQAVETLEPLPAKTMAAGQQLLERGDPRGALQTFDRVLASNPDNAAAWCNRGIAQAALGLTTDAVDSFSRSLDLNPGLEAGYNNLCLALSELGRFVEANATANRGMQRFPNSLPLQLATATVLHRAGDLKAAKAQFDATLAEHIANTDGRIGLALVLQDMGDLAGAEALLREVLRIQPRHANARLCVAFLELMQSQFARGWRDYEARYGTPEAPLTLPNLPVWNGENLTGKRLLIVGEQGLGDEIMFSSCIGDLAGRARHIEIWSHAKLVSLFQRSFLYARVDKRTDENTRTAAQASKFDFQIPMGSLPRLLRNSTESFPRHTGYLRADINKRNAWRERLASLGPGPKVGISWRGGLFKTRRVLRSITIAEFFSLIDVPNVHFVNLQHDASSEEIAELSKRAHGTFHSFPDEVSDHEELAALVMNLDLVISVQGSIVHLAGALGRPTWALLPSCPEWRYGAAGEAMLWYPSMRLFRQQHLGEWKPLLQKLRSELESARAQLTKSQSAEPTLSAAELVQRASALIVEGNITEARAGYERALEVDPAYMPALQGLERLHIQQQEPEVAHMTALWQAAVGAQPRAPLLLVGLSQAQLRQRDVDAAKQSAELALEADHACPATHAALGRTHLERGDIDEAFDCFRLALHFDPHCAAGHSGCGAVANARGDYPAALPHFEKALALEPELGEACCGLAVALDKQQRAEEAIPYYEAAVAANPSDTIARSNLGLVLRTQGRYGEALSLLEPTVKLAPRSVGTLCNLALVRQDMGQLDLAIDLFNRALELAPDDAELHVNRALTQLLKGRFAEGWLEYEWRAKLPDMLPRPFGFTPWKGEGTPPMRILVYGEQGLGDEIMFASCLPDLLDMGHQVVIECDPRLAPLYARSFPTTLVHGRLRADDTSWISSAGHIDRQTPIGSLPGFFRRSATSFPRHAGYLKADPAGIGHWQARLAELGPGLKVGVSWRGGAPRTRSHLRSVELARLLPQLDTPGVHFISVQYGDTQDALAALRKESHVHIHEFVDALSDYDQTAALCCALDLVISVQTAIVHLCGALGRPVWAMIPFAPEWRYMRDTDTLPWYPTARLFRQAIPGDWDGVISKVSRALKEFADAGTASNPL